jgi:hypothetical protein
MTRLNPLWQQAGNYDAITDRQLVAALWPAGGASGPPVNVAANTMNVNIPAGLCAVAMQSASQGSALCRWDANESLTIAAAPPTGQSRIDLVVCQVRDAAIVGGSDNDFVFVDVIGTPAVANPVPPAVPANSFALCRITVPGAVANLNTATLVDVRTGLVPAQLPVVAQYAPATQATYTIGGGATAIDATNLRISFTAPASGRVVARWSGFCALTANAILSGAMYVLGGGIVGTSQYLAQAAGGALQLRAQYEEVLSGLTPLAPYTLVPYAFSGGGAATSIYVGGPGNLGGANNAGAFFMAVDPL